MTGEPARTLPPGTPLNPERVLGAPGEALHRFRLLGVPLRLWAAAAEHHEELLREFALVAFAAEEHGQTLPRRLSQLIADVRSRYGGASPSDTAARDAALAAGLQTLDLTYRVPAAVADASHSLGALLDEADEFCAADAYLLTLATPPQVVAFRRWFLGEFVRQVAGEPPRPWSGPLD
jgi:hypothetical protein